MDLNRLTQKSQQALQSAQSLAIEYQNQQLEQCHLLWALCADGEGLIPELLKKMGADGGRVADAARAEAAKLPRVTGGGRDPEKIYISADTDRALTAAEKAAGKMKDDYISVEHLMLGLFEAAGREVSEIFRLWGLDKDKFLAALMQVRGN